MSLLGSRSRPIIDPPDPFVPPPPNKSPYRVYGKWEDLGVDFDQDGPVDIGKGPAEDLAPPCEFVNNYWGDVEDTTKVRVFKLPTADYKPITYDEKTVSFSDNEMVSHY